MQTDIGYTVVRNDAAQYSICFTFKPIPQGWSEVGFRGAREECFDYIEKVRTGGLTKAEDSSASAFLRACLPWSHPSSSQLIHSRIAPYATYAPWLGDAEFMACYESAKRYTLVDIYRCYELWQLARQSRAVKGDIVEVGVWRGGTGLLLAHAVAGSGQRVFLADTFCGVVKSGDLDPLYTDGEHSDASAAGVRALLAEHNLRNATVLQGVFPEETEASIDGPLSLVHIDVDVYQSAKDVLEWALPRLSAGAAVVFDDYGFYGCEGVTRLVNEFRAADPPFHFIYNVNGHAILLKR